MTQNNQDQAPRNQEGKEIWVNNQDN